MCHVHIATPMSLYSGVLQGALVVFAAWTALLLGIGPRGLAVVFAASIVNLALFWCEHQVRKPAWDVLLRLHVAFAAVPLLLACVSRLGAARSVMLFTVYVGPMALIDRSHLAVGSLTRAEEIPRVQTSSGR